MDKTELLEQLEDSRQAMVEVLEGLPDEVLLEPGVVGNWSIKDILAHLTYWEGQIVTLLFQAKRGSAPSTAHFGKETVDQVNQRWYESGKDRSLEIIWSDWEGVRKQTIRRVQEFTDQELNDPDRYPWQQGNPLFQWILDDSVSHEEEHADQISDWLEAREGQDDHAGSNGHSKS